MKQFSNTENYGNIQSVHTPSDILNPVLYKDWITK